MSQRNDQPGTEWIFCRDLKGECSGLNPNTKVIEKIPKTITIHGKEVKGWKVKIVQEKGEGHVKVNYSGYSDE